MLKYRRLLVTGGAGFIGSAFIRKCLEKFPELEHIVNLDLLTYAANQQSLPVDSRHRLIQGNIQDADLLEKLCETYQIEAIVHFAAESHVDRSINDPSAFIKTNILGTFSLLETVRKYPHIHFHHVSTDEVYGSLTSGFFNESSPYKPNSPYSASKAASDHLVRAWAQTYELSTTLSHCSNNYGPYQHEEKFIPRMISSCLKNEPLPVYGQGLNVRDWLYVDDHADALLCILNSGQRGQVYDIGGNTERKNIELLHTLIDLVAKKTNQSQAALHKNITFVSDRPGHDFRYAIDSSKISQELGWKPRHSLEEGLEKTVQWFLDANVLRI